MYSTNNLYRCLYRSTIKDKIIPHAVSWYTGEALQGEDFEEEAEEDDGEEEDEEDEEDEDDEEDEEEETNKVSLLKQCAH